MSWFRREDNKIVGTGEKTVRTEGLWIKCDSCGQAIFKAGRNPRGLAKKEIA